MSRPGLCGRVYLLAPAGAPAAPCVLPKDHRGDYCRNARGESWIVGAGEKLADRVHDHFDVCEQCREHPFALCPTGAELLRLFERSLSPIPDGIPPSGERR